MLDNPVALACMCSAGSRLHGFVRRVARLLAC